MNQREKFKHILDRALSKGFKLKDHKHFTEVDHYTGSIAAYESIIFDKDFARAFWGDELLCYDCGEKVGPPIMVGESIQIGTGQCNCSRQFENNEPAWEYHLKQLVVQDDYIDYLHLFIEGAL